MTLIYAYQDRGITRNLQILDADGDVITPGANDHVRVIIGRDGQTAVLTVTDASPTTNGSTLTKGATNVLRLDASDLGAITPGTYNLYFDYYDNADAKEWKLVDKQVFFLEGSREIVDISQVLLEMGLTSSPTDEERALISTAIRQAEKIVASFLRYDPVLGQRVEYYPLQDVDLVAKDLVYETTETEAYLRAKATGTSELQVLGIPIRENPAIDLRIDYDGRSGTRDGAFAASTQKTEGSDFWPNYDGVDSDGYRFCRDGLIRSIGLWPTNPGSVKITYYSGYSHDELQGDDANLDASPILQATMIEAIRRAKRRLVRKKSAIAGHVAGIMSSEHLGDYSYNIDTSLGRELYGDNNSLMGESVELLMPFRNLAFEV